ncbi:MAG: efflux RND transporter periplasmic adaptor subunit [Alphaproteobacteria bacterium]|uniref:efflux RND transporter periplasmic adaptor subunit n=1 Tax=Aestuariivirga sp. TaxID=2650926 RepID=UPI003016CE9F|nr:efflux RND transporter periplasmic adaptor subunit [Alphaproteobacteria bacterium]
MIRRILYFLLVTVLLGGLAGAIAFYAFDFKPKMLATVILGAPRPPETISAEPARTDTWQPQITGIGTVTAFQGIDVTPQVGGLVTEINFESGQDVKKGDLLVKLDTGREEADIRSIQAELANNQTELARREGLVSKGVVAITELDSLKTKQRTLQATLDRRNAEIAQKFIYAPWDGRVGLRNIALGSFLAPGQKIVWLQKIDPVYVDFNVTEADYGRIKQGEKVTVTLNAYPGQSFTGKIVTTDARLSDTNRMIMVRAEMPNPDKKLVPGMYANVLVDVGAPEQVVTVPQTAVTYSLYGDNIFVVNATKVKDKDGKDVDELVVERRFVKAGPVRDGRVSIVSGIKDGDKVVTAGQNKIDQGSKVVIDNSIALKLQDTSTIQ